MGRKRKKYIEPEEFVVMNKNGEVFVGLLYGVPYFSLDWSLAKPLEINHTKILLRNKDNELIKTTDL
jgi:hypothetical protein